MFIWKPEIKSFFADSRGFSKLRFWAFFGFQERLGHKFGGSSYFVAFCGLILELCIQQRFNQYFLIALKKLVFLNFLIQQIDKIRLGKSALIWYFWPGVHVWERGGGQARLKLPNVLFWGCNDFFLRQYFFREHVSTQNVLDARAFVATHTLLFWYLSFYLGLEHLKSFIELIFWFFSIKNSPFFWFFYNWRIFDFRFHPFW